MTASRRKRARESESENEHKESVLKNVMLSRVGNAGSSNSNNNSVIESWQCSHKNNNNKGTEMRTAAGSTVALIKYSIFHCVVLLFYPLSPVRPSVVLVALSVVLFLTGSFATCGHWMGI